MKNQKLIFAVTNDLTYDRRMYRICSTLAEAGADVTLIGRVLHTSKPFAPELFKGVRIKCWFHSGLRFYAEYNIRLFFWLLTHDYTIACACDLDTALPVRFASWIKRKKTVYDAHEYFTEVPEITARPVIKSIWSGIANLTIGGFDLRYTVGSCLAKLMGEKYQVPFDVIRNIPSEQQTSRATNPVASIKILLYQGAINEGRGLEAIINSISMLPGWEFWLAGEGDLTEQLKLQAAQDQVADRVRFLGWVHPNDLPDLMSQATLGINLREIGSLNDYNSLPNKFFDFIHAGLPSINMKYPEYEAINQQYECSYLINAVSINEICDAVQLLDKDINLMNLLKANCIGAAKEFTWKNESTRLKTLYETL